MTRINQWNSSFFLFFDKHTAVAVDGQNESTMNSFIFGGIARAMAFDAVPTVK